MTTKKQVLYAEQRARGQTREASAIIAGLSTDGGNLSEMEAKPAVQTEVARIRALTAQNLDIKKEDIAKMFLDAAAMARIAGDITGLVAAAKELGKMLGFYAPEVKKIITGLDARALKKALSEMSDEELYALKHGRTFEGSFSVLPAAEGVPEVPQSESPVGILPSGPPDLPQV